LVFEREKSEQAMQAACFDDLDRGVPKDAVLQLFKRKYPSYSHQSTYQTEKIFRYIFIAVNSGS
jgi:hypothetical protein